MGRRKRQLSSIDNATAKALLDKYLPTVYALRPLFPEVDDATLRATGEDAILEGYLTLDTSRSKEEYWIRQVIRWRLMAIGRPWDYYTERFDPDPITPNGVDPEEAFWRATCISALGHLPPRQQMIVEGRMKGFTLAEMAVKLGVSHTVVHRESKRAFATLRDLLTVRLPGDVD